MRFLRTKRGIAIVYVTLFLMVLGILFVALGVDVGWLAYVRSQSQAAVDAAALSGAAAIPKYNQTGGTDEIDQMIRGVTNTVMNASAELTIDDAEFCWGDPENPTCSSSPPDFRTVGGVRITKTFAAPLYFARLFNGNQRSDITVSATGWLGGVRRGRPGLPVTVCGEAFGFNFNNPSDYGSCKPGLAGRFYANGSDNAGYWNFMAEANAKDCKDMVEGKKPVPEISVGDMITLNNGEIASCHNALEVRFKGCDKDACDGKKGEGERKRCTAIVPVVDCPNSINQTEEVRGFVAVCFTNIGSKGNPKPLDVQLDCNVQLEESWGAGPNFGVYADRPVLVK
jgi:hypothetical protein